MACEHALNEIQTALLGLFRNLPLGWVGSLLSSLVFPFGARFAPPGDHLGSLVARGLLEDRQSRLVLTQDIFVPGKEEVGLGRLEAALDKAVDALRVEAKLRDAVRAGILDRAPGDQLAENAVEAGLISVTELGQLREADEIRDEVIQVDAFDPDVYAELR